MSATLCEYKAQRANVLFTAAESGETTGHLRSQLTSSQMLGSHGPASGACGAPEEGVKGSAAIDFAGGSHGPDQREEHQRVHVCVPGRALGLGRPCTHCFLCCCQGIGACLDTTVRVKACLNILNLYCVVSTKKQHSVFEENCYTI